MKLHSIFFCLILVLFSCKLQSAQRPYSYYLLAPQEIDAKATHFITDKAGIKPWMLFVQFPTETGRWSCKLVPMPIRPIISNHATYEVRGYFNKNSKYIRINPETQALLIPYSTQGKVDSLTIEKK